MLRVKLGAAFLAAVVLMAGAAYEAARAQGEVNVYSFRQPYLIDPIMEKFTEKTGIEVNTLFARKGLLERLEAEGANSPADLVVAPEIQLTVNVKKAGLTQAVDSDVLESAISAQFRDSEGHWFALTSRSRAVIVAPDRVDRAMLTDYLSLADDRWDGRICIRSGLHPYNIALFASMIAHHGEARVEEFLRGLKSNLARKPQGGDTDQIKAVSAGQCDIAISNTYYFGRMLASDEMKEIADGLELIYPNQDGEGAHMNVSSVVMAKHAPNRENALALMEFMVSDDVQRVYAEANYEYPVKPGVELAPIVASWGEFKEDDLPLETLVEYQDEAIRLVNKVNFDEGPGS